MSEAASPASNEQAVYVVPFADLRMKDVPAVGGKNASLGEMISQLQEKGVRVPGGFATTSQAYRDFWHTAPMAEKRWRNGSKTVWQAWISAMSARWPKPVPKSASGSSKHRSSHDWNRRF